MYKLYWIKKDENEYIGYDEEGKPFRYAVRYATGWSCENEDNSGAWDFATAEEAMNYGDKEYNEYMEELTEREERERAIEFERGRARLFGVTRQKGDNKNVKADEEKPDGEPCEPDDRA